MCSISCIKTCVLNVYFSRNLNSRNYFFQINLVEDCFYFILFYILLERIENSFIATASKGMYK